LDKTAEDKSLYSVIFEQAVEGMILTDPEGVILDANPAALGIFGYEGKEEVLGQAVEILVPAPIREAHQKHRKQFQSSPHARPMGQGLSLQGLKKNGENIALEISLSPITLEKRQLVLAHIIDISERKKLQKVHSDNKTLLKSIIDNAVDGIITIDANGRIESLNPAAAHLFGYEQEEVLGKNVRMLMPEPYHSEHDRYLENYHQTGVGKIIGIGREVFGKRKDGSTFPFRLSISEVKYKDRKIFTGVIHDISSMKEAEQKLISYAKNLERSNRELEDFAYVSSHDLQEPLRKIQAFGNWLQDKEADKFSPKGKDYLNRMLSAASRLQRLINDLLSYSRISTKAKPFGEVDLNHTLETVLSDLELLIQSKDALILADELPILEADETQMRQLLQNLISNAVKFTEEGVQPRVEINGRSYLHRGADHRTEKWVVLKITDNGIGFDEKYKDKIFSIFQRLEGQKYQGSGIGLAIVKRIIHRHGGEIRVESEKGKGTTFLIHLPLLQHAQK